MLYPAVRFVQILQHKHAVVTLEIVKHDDDVTVIAIVVLREGIQMFKHVVGTVGPIKSGRVVLVFRF